MVDWTRIVVKHALIIVAVWIVLSALSAPLAIRIDEVTEYRAERLMPNTTESMEASQLLGRAGATMAYDILLVDNVNTSDPSLIWWDKEFNKSVNGYVESYMSPYLVMREAYEEAEPGIRNMSNALVEAAKAMRPVFIGILDNYTVLVEMVNQTHMLVAVLSMTAEQLVENYGYIDMAAGMLSENASMIIYGYINASRGLNESRAALSEMRGLATLIYNALVVGDNYYSSTLPMLDDIYQNITMLNTTLVLLNNAYYSTRTLYSRSLYDAARIHYFLETKTAAYRTGNLSEADVATVIYYCNLSGDPVSPDEVNIVYQTIYGYIASNATVNDTVIAVAANNTFAYIVQGYPYELRMAMLGYNAYYSKELLAMVEQSLAENGYGNMTQPIAMDEVDGQLVLRSIIYGVSYDAMPGSVQEFAEATAPAMAPYIGINASLLEQIMIDAYHLGENYTAEQLMEHVVDDMYMVASAVQGPLPPNATKTLFRLIYIHGPVPEAALNATTVLLYEIMPCPPGVPELVTSNIALYDPQGEGVIASNETLLRRLTGVKLHEYTGLPLEITMPLFNASDDMLWVLAAQLMIYGMNQSGVDNPMAYAMVEQALIHRGAVSRSVLVDVLLNITASAASSMGNVSMGNFSFTLPRSLAEYIVDTVLRNETPSYTYVAETLVLVMLWSQAVNMTQGAPISLEALFNENTSVIRLVIETRGHPTGEELREAIVNDTLRIMETMMAANASAAPPINTSTLVPLVRRLVTIEYPAEKYLYEDLAEELLVNMTREMMSSGAMPVGGTAGFELNETLVEEAVERLIETRDVNGTIKWLFIVSAEEMAGGEMPEDMLTEIIDAAVTTLDSKTVYEKARSLLLDEIFSNIYEAFKGQMISPDNTSFIILVDPRGDSDEEKYDSVMKAKDAAASTLRDHGYGGVDVQATGDHVLGYEAKQSGARDIETINRVSMIAPLVIALILIGGVLATGLPFIGLGIAVLTSMAAIYVLGYLGVVDITSWSRMLMITTAFGLGVDYSSYIILRFKEEIAKGVDKERASHVALKQSLPAILASSSTDIIGFAVMMLAWEFPLIASIGETVPIAIAAVLAVSLTLTPALLALLGDKKWFWWPRGPHRHVVEGRVLLTRRVAALLIILTAVFALFGTAGLLGFQGSHDYSVFMPENNEGYKAYMLLQEKYPAGQLMPIYVVGVVADGYNVTSNESMKAIRDLADRIKSDPDVDVVYGPHDPGTKTRDTYIIDNRTFYLEVILRPAPLSREGIEATKRVRSIVHSYESPVLEKLLVGGVAAGSLEMEELLTRIFWHRIMPVGMVLMWIAMTLSFQSVWPGILALVTIFVGYSVGVSTAAAVAAWNDQPALWFLPLMTFPAVLGVGMDYNSFYMNRVREELEKLAGSPGAGERAASIAVRAVSVLVIGLGLIVSSTYGALILGSSWGVREIGMALSIGVLTITLLSALAFTPAIMALMGEKAWWPLSRRWRKRGVRKRDQ